MFRHFKSLGLKLTRPLRVFFNARSSDVRNYKAQDVIAVDIANDIQLETQTWLKSIFAFTSSSVRFSFLPQHGIENPLAMHDYLNYYFDEKPSALLYLGREPDQEEISALKLLEIPYRSVAKFEPIDVKDDFPKEDADRAKWHKVFERRQLLYVHLERAQPIEAILEATRIAKRNIPDLLLVISGLNFRDIPNSKIGLSLARESGQDKLAHFADIYLLKSNRFNPVIASLSSATLLSQGLNLRAHAEETIRRASAVVFYDVRSQSLGKLSDYVNSGSAVSVSKSGSLSATLSQVLHIEDSASFAVQSLSRYTEVEHPVLLAIDELVGEERAL